MTELIYKDWRAPAEIQKELKEYWANPVQHKIQRLLNPLKLRVNLEPHIAKPGYSPNVDGGAEVWAGYSIGQILKSKRISPIVKAETQYTLDCAAEDSTRQELAEYKKELYCWMKIRLLMEYNSDNDLALFVDGYWCFDEYGRDRIPWLKYYGAEPSQTTDKALDYSAVMCASEFEDKGDLLSWLTKTAEAAVSHTFKLKGES